MGEGLAFPHVRGVEGGSLTLAMGVSRKGIDWGGTKVNIVFLSAIPVAVSAFYLRMMSALAQAFNKPANREAAFSAEDQAALWKSLVRATRTSFK
jgi:mannitol/fructose-specific phosphotransferase system IIA component (Ntr-type)